MEELGDKWALMEISCPILSLLPVALSCCVSEKAIYGPSWESWSVCTLIAIVEQIQDFAQSCKLYNRSHSVCTTRCAPKVLINLAFRADVSINLHSVFPVVAGNWPFSGPHPSYVQRSSGRRVCLHMPLLESLQLGGNICTQPTRIRCQSIPGPAS